MKIVKVLIAAIVVLIVAIAAVGLLLPSSYQVERSIVIDAAPEEVHEYVGNLKKWDDWGPWKEEDPSMVVSLGEKTSGVGASQSWVGDSGTGALTITESSPSEGIRYDLLFDGGTYECTSSMTYDRLQDGRTEVTWEMSGDMGRSVTGGYFAVLMDSMVGNMFDKGLSNLKREVEENE
ncbi:MAG: SRPBCC family protein [Deltaproteobacteria bacterium]